MAFEKGISDYDTGETPEKGVLWPWVIDPKVSWLQYQNWMEIELDSGLVVHKTLPQSALPTLAGNPPIPNADSFGNVDIYDPNGGAVVGGVNIQSREPTYEDIVQRMATSKYRFCLRGFAVRAGYQIPIPKLVSIGGTTAIPDDDRPQKVRTQIVANNSGIPVYFASWALWYTIAKPPKGTVTPPPNYGQQIAAVPVVDLPLGIQVPLAFRDDYATSEPPPPPPFEPAPPLPLQNPIQGP